MEIMLIMTKPAVCMPERQHNINHRSPFTQGQMK